ncbi:hypothetical protein SUGI_1133550 [Cryptomeria japonica]|uniref:ricin B-like lectin EULS3 n=1 Tax=Cryptomeria japonica TaxID=3369 RepID=UPI0024147A72|nr:ricin B-like lectin EULS3 [Cryptomeria japonica]XP_059069992.1 ricin B-like lectin EULS3 [Cryptomeria japonica]GLJ53191.1 hypothetical protein SUGI_1133550 [Cryptomeria japonica]
MRARDTQTTVMVGVANSRTMAVISLSIITVSNRGTTAFHGQIVRVCSKANPDYALGIRDGRAMLVYYNPSDPTQQWVKDKSWSNRVRDAVGHPAFELVNKATGQALRHAPAACQEVLLTKYEGGSYDESVLWSESEDMGYGYKTIRMANDIGLNLDAFQGDRKHGGIQEGTRVVLWKWNKQDNQLWKISPCY